MGAQYQVSYAIFLLSMTALRPEHVPALIHASSNTPHGVASKRKLAHGVPLRQGHQLYIFFLTHVEPGRRVVL